MCASHANFARQCLNLLTMHVCLHVDQGSDRPNSLAKHIMSRTFHGIIMYMYMVDLCENGHY